MPPDPFRLHCDFCLKDFSNCRFWSEHIYTCGKKPETVQAVVKPKELPKTYKNPDLCCPHCGQEFTMAFSTKRHVSQKRCDPRKKKDYQQILLNPPPESIAPEPVATTTSANSKESRPHGTILRSAIIGRKHLVSGPIPVNARCPCRPLRHENLWPLLLTLCSDGYENEDPFERLYNFLLATIYRGSDGYLDIVQKLYLEGEPQYMSLKVHDFGGESTLAYINADGDLYKDDDYVVETLVRNIQDILLQTEIYRYQKALHAAGKTHEVLETHPAKEWHAFINIGSQDKSFKREFPTNLKDVLFKVGGKT